MSPSSIQCINYIENLPQASVRQIVLSLLEVVSRKAMEWHLWSKTLINQVLPHSFEVTIESQLENIVAKDPSSKLSPDVRVGEMFGRRDGV